MYLPRSQELVTLLDQASGLARELEQERHTGHALLAYFLLANAGRLFLEARGVSRERVLHGLRELPLEQEGLLDDVLRRAHELATMGLGRAQEVSTVHLLLAMVSFVDASGCKVLAGCGLDIASFRSELAQALTRGVLQEDSALRASQPRAPHETQQPERVARKGPTRRVTSPSLRPGRRLSLAERLFGEPTEPERPRSAIQPASLPLPPAVQARRAKAASNRQAARVSSQSTGQVPAVARALPRQHFQLSEAEYPLLSKLGRNLCLEAIDGRIDNVVGRDREVEQLVDVLNKRRSNNPVLVGDPGVGKTAVVEGLAWICTGLAARGVASGLEGKILVELEASRMISGTSLRGSFSERIQRLRKEVDQAEGRVILFLDELHQWIGMGGGDSPGDAAGELKTALARGTLPCIGATTYDEYRRHIEADPALQRRFQVVRVEEPTEEQAVDILLGVQHQYEAHHGVTYTSDAMRAAVSLSHRYLPDQRLPDKAIGVMDLSGSRARRLGMSQVDRSLVATLVAERAGLSVQKLLRTDQERFLDMEQHLLGRVVGHEDSIARVAHLLRRNYAGFGGDRPIGSFLLLGPTGVGKTELARALSEVLFEQADALVRLDMSEYMESHSVARLIGAPPGYVGHEQGGLLTEAVRRRPYSLVLFDEVEKAHPDVLNLLLQLLDTGKLTDSRGRVIDFRQCVVFLTANLGAEVWQSSRKRAVGFAASAEGDTSADTAQQVLDIARRAFRPEIWARVDEKLVFRPLSREHVASITRMLLRESSRRLYADRNISFICKPEVIDLLLADDTYDASLGARQLRRLVEARIETPIAELLLRGEFPDATTLEVDVERGTLAIRVLDAEDGPTPSQALVALR